MRHGKNKLDWLFEAADALDIALRWRRSAEGRWGIDYLSARAWELSLRERGVRGTISTIGISQRLPVVSGGLIYLKRAKKAVFISPDKGVVHTIAKNPSDSGAALEKQAEFLVANQGRTSLLPYGVSMHRGPGWISMRAPFFCDPIANYMKRHNLHAAEVLNSIAPSLIETYKNINVPVTTGRTARLPACEIPDWFESDAVVEVCAHSDLGLGNLRYDGKNIIAIDWLAKKLNIFHDIIHWESRFGDRNGALSLKRCIQSGNCEKMGSECFRGSWDCFIKLLGELVGTEHLGTAIRSNLFYVFERIKEAGIKRELGGKIANKRQQYVYSLYR